MPFASYTLRHVFWILWSWEAGRDGVTFRRGHALGQRAARWCARSAIRASRLPLDPAGEEVVVEPRRKAA